MNEVLINKMLMNIIFEELIEYYNNITINIDLKKIFDIV
jgi:hypothetical protein